MRTVRVQLQDRAYDIFLGQQLLPRLGELLKPATLAHRCLVVSDENVARLYADKTLAALRASGYEATLVTVPAGESSKSLTQVAPLYAACAAQRLDRQSFIVALGGGVVGDLAGFVAATYLRGIPFVQIPTSLLAQVDSSVGGKVGIDLPQGKNLVGAFWQPRVVVADLDTLRTLPPREFAAGMAEVIKTAAIRDAALFERLEKSLDALFNFDMDALGNVIARCCEIKAEVVAADERETKGVREILNFGHTIGHAVEAADGYKTLLHGEAVSVGMKYAAALSVKHAGLAETDAERLVRLLERCNLPKKLPPKISAAEILDRMKLDKKFRDGKLRFVLLKRLGEAVVSDAVQEKNFSELFD
jgi:3-dehydroquinate synthase